MYALVYRIGLYLSGLLHSETGYFKDPFQALKFRHYCVNAIAYY